VLAEVARILANHHISIASVIQHEALDNQEGSTVPLVIMTHSAPTGNFIATISALNALETVAAPAVFFPVGE
jgi:homoserine dehydrogenase